MSKFYHPAFIGFDRLLKLLEDVEHSTTNNTGWPPYNLIGLPDNKYLVEMAVAGFSERDIDVTLEENLLTISAISPENNSKYIHRGIAGRSFTRKFTLADTVEIRDVHLQDGMLRITLENVIPEAKKPKKLTINTGSPQLLVEEKSEGKAKKALASFAGSPRK